MTIEEIEKKLLPLAEKYCSKDDYAHDFLHAKRVMNLCKHIGEEEGGNLKILIPAGLFHDIIIYPKNDPRSPLAQEESADLAEEILKKEFNCYTQGEIEQIKKIITECSFSKNIEKTCIEGKIIQDADGLEAIGAVAIARTFYSSGQMIRPFYNESDPFCEKRKPLPKDFALDLFPARLFEIRNRLYTQTAKRIAKKREDFLHRFIEQFKEEIEGY